MNRHTGAEWCCTRLSFRTMPAHHILSVSTSLSPLVVPTYKFLLLSFLLFARSVCCFSRGAFIVFAWTVSLARMPARLSPQTPPTPSPLVGHFSHHIEILCFRCGTKNEKLLHRTPRVHGDDVDHSYMA